MAVGVLLVVSQNALFDRLATNFRLLFARDTRRLHERHEVLIFYLGLCGLCVASRSYPHTVANLVEITEKLLRKSDTRALAVVRRRANRDSCRWVVNFITVNLQDGPCKFEVRRCHGVSRVWQLALNVRG